MRRQDCLRVSELSSGFEGIWRTPRRTVTEWEGRERREERGEVEREQEGTKTGKVGRRGARVKGERGEGKEEDRRGRKGKRGRGKEEGVLNRNAIIRFHWWEQELGPDGEASRWVVVITELLSDPAGRGAPPPPPPPPPPQALRLLLLLLLLLPDTFCSCSRR